MPLKPIFTSTPTPCSPRSRRTAGASSYLAYPNNPTGTLYDDADMERIIAAAASKSLVVIDEAYQPFSAQAGCRARLDRTSSSCARSKLGLAGIRLGYLAGPAALVTEFDKVRPPYNINALTRRRRSFALDHADVLARQAALLRDERARLQRELAALAGVTAFPSEANMILVRVAETAAVFAGLKRARVLMKNVRRCTRCSPIACV